MVSPSVIFQELNNPSLPDFNEIASYSNTQYSFFFCLALGLTNIFKRKSERNLYNKRTYRTTSSCIDNCTRTLMPDDLESTKELFQIIYNSEHPIKTLSNWVSFYFSQNTNQIVERLIRVFYYIANCCIFNSQGFILSQDTFEKLLNEFPGILGISIALYRSPNFEAPVFYSPNDYGTFPTIFMANSSNPIEFFYLVHNSLKSFDNDLLKNLDLKSFPFSYSRFSEYQPSFSLPRPPQPKNESSTKDVYQGEELALFGKLYEILVSAVPRRAEVMLQVEDLLKNSSIIRKIPEIASTLKSELKLKCRLCGYEKKKEEFMIECGENRNCVVCDSCRKNNPIVCIICGRTYSDYDIQKIHYFKLRN